MGSHFSNLVQIKFLLHMLVQIKLHELPPHILKKIITWMFWNTLVMFLQTFHTSLQ